jgi:putative transposase
MYQPEWQQLSLGLHLEPCLDGRSRGRSKRLGRRTDKGDTTSIQLSIFDQAINQPSYTLEFPVTLKNLSWTDKYSFLSVVTPIAKSSKTLDQDSISNEKVYLPYWNEFCQAMSEWLSLPTKIDYADLGSTLSHGSQAGANVRYWFSTTVHLAQNARWLKIFLPSSTFSVADSTDLGSTSKRLKKTLTYRVYPKGETKKVWMSRVHAYRKVYNNAIAYLNQHQGFTYINNKGEKTTGKKAFRSFCKTLGEEIIPDWCKQLGIAHALDNALFEA